MVYFLHKDMIAELKPRMEYLYQVFHLWYFVAKPIGDFIQLKQFPDIDDGVRFITGHNKQVEQMLCSNNIEAEVVVLNTCYPWQFKRYAKEYSRLYICHPSNQIGNAEPRNGNDFGLGFDVLDSELYLLRSKGLLIDRLDESYYKIDWMGH